MLGSVLSLLAPLLLALIIGYCVLVAYSLVNPVTIPSPPREVPILMLPPADESDDQENPQ